MIQTLSHTTIYVLDQEAARKFYVEKLGFEVRADMTLGAFRWLTVSPKAQPGLQMILMPLGVSPAMDAATADALKAVVKSGAMGCGILETDDCQSTYEQLKQQGVEFRTPPTQRPYGLEAVLLDNSGNWFSLVQRPR
ncbi:MAG TPA: VOC family protein [Polyangiaceae bacterium]|nr:VOC family protein [Polyangiaceae bacterium]